MTIVKFPVSKRKKTKREYGKRDIPFTEMDLVRQVYTLPAELEHRREVEAHLLANRFLLSFLYSCGTWLKEAFSQDYDCIRLEVLDGNLQVIVRTSGIFSEDLDKLSRFEDDVVLPMIGSLEAIRFDVTDE